MGLCGNFTQMHPTYCRPYVLKSDHHPIIFDITVSNVFKIPEKRLHYNFKNANFDAINLALQQIPLSTGVFNISSQEHFDTAWELWNDFAFATIELLCSKSSRKKSKSPTVDKRRSCKSHKKEENYVEKGQEIF